MADLYLVKMKNGSFTPATSNDIDVAKKFEAGEIYPAKIWKRRNVKFHRKFFELLNMIFDMQEKYTNERDLRVEITLKCGFYEEHLTEKGKIVYIPKSISFEKMDDVEFEKLYNKAIDVCIRDYAKGKSAHEIDFKIDQILGFA